MVGAGWGKLELMKLFESFFFIFIYFIFIFIFISFFWKL